jgi:uncharacterized protein (DUF1501 family)
MYLLQPERHSRRAFLKRAGQLALTGSALPLALNLAAMGEAAAFTSSSGDYKALVCVFLYGGNDYGNTVVPYDDASYDLYSSIRGGGAGRTAAGIALGQSALTPNLLQPTAVPLDALGATNRQFALNPAMTALAGLFNTVVAGKSPVAVQLNVGPLVKPLTRDQYNSADHVSFARPPQLFSHNDQQSIWQSSSPEGSTIGWGGNMADLALAGSSPLNAGSASTFTCMSVTGNAVFLSGDTALQYQVSTSGAIKINAAGATPAYGSAAVNTAINALLRQSRSHSLEFEYNKVSTRALAAGSFVKAALDQTDATLGTPLATAFAADSLAQQLKMVARLIKGRASLGAGVRRQVFLVSQGGFDLHDNLIRDHGPLLAKVSDAMTAFYNASVEIGVANQVTAFTASDFGRTLASNGDGSDHGWGSHHFVVGGAVNGARFYGTAPPVSTSDAKTGNAYLPANQWHVGQGRLLPSTAVDQYAATLAQWFGVDASEMAGVLPKIGNFGGAGYPVDLGFMGP